MEEKKSRVLILGAGRSSAHLIQYLLNHATELGIHLRVGDADVKMAEEKVGASTDASVFECDAENENLLESEMAHAEIVVSMLPAFMHPKIAKLCLKLHKHLITPSYLSSEMMSMDQEARAKNLIFLNEMGVDPGIDHMSAMKIIHALKQKGADIHAFYSLTGGLIAPESDNNPWNYKITWNPRNVVLAGAGGTAHYRENGKDKLIPYQRLFERTMSVEIPNYGEFEGYANRDSMAYEELYDLPGIPTLYRGTLRKKGFSQAWNVLVQWGLTDDTRVMNWDQMSMQAFTQTFLPDDSLAYIKREVSNEVLYKLQWLGLWDVVPVPIKRGTAAQVIQALIEERWSLAPLDRDMLVMCHLFDYALDGKHFRMQSSMVLEGENNRYTAMSATVGLPMAIAVKHILNDSWKQRGVILPIHQEIYEPILEELIKFNIQFTEQIKEC
jgi:saccharopine dehydrogenase-like NADP-dependent oxidoreductase